MDRDLQKYLRPEYSSTPCCPGCGHGIIMGLMLRAIDELGININEFVFVSGAGCSIWLPCPQIQADTLNGLHGRAIAFATGMKLFNPKLRVVVFAGDGDLIDIGGNHLIHAARRNMDLTVICGNNFVYGTTGGQVTCTTPRGSFTATTTKGNSYRPFDLSKLLTAAGAAYVSRYSVTQPIALKKSIQKALQNQGFSFIEVLSPCPTQFGRRNMLDNPADMFKFLMNKCITKEQAQSLSPDEIEGKIITGEFGDGDK